MVPRGAPLGRYPSTPQPRIVPDCGIDQRPTGTSICHGCGPKKTKKKKKEEESQRHFLEPDAFNCETEAEPGKWEWGGRVWTKGQKLRNWGVG